MKQSLVKLVDVILRRIEDQPDTLPSENGIRSWLQGEGYGKRDLEAAIKLIRPQMEARYRSAVRQPETVRTLTFIEEQKLSPEARNALARLQLFGLITPFDREAVLDRLEQFDGEVGLAELDYLLSWTMLGGLDVASQQTIYSVLDGEGTVYH